jgi:hypothetical protein
MHIRYLTLFAVLSLAACVAPPSPPAPKIVAAPPPSATTPPPRLTGDWNDWPFTPGNWTYRRDSRGSVAQFGMSGRNPMISFRCDVENRRITLSREASAPGAGLVIRTSSMTKTLAATAPDSNSTYLTANITTTDPILDAMAFSRGRVLVEMEGQPPAILPSWAEIARVVEDCRG